MSNILKDKWGPFPVWIWLAILVGGILVYWFFIRQFFASSASSAPASSDAGGSNAALDQGVSGYLPVPIYADSVSGFPDATGATAPTTPSPASVGAVSLPLPQQQSVTDQLQQISNDLQESTSTSYATDAANAYLRATTGGAPLQIGPNIAVAESYPTVGSVGPSGQVGAVGAIGATTQATGDTTQYASDPASLAAAANAQHAADLLAAAGPIQPNPSIPWNPVSDTRRIP